MSYLCQAIPGVDFVDIPDVVFSREDGEQASVGVVELNKRTDKHGLNVWPRVLQLYVKHRKGPTILETGIREQFANFAWQ